MGLYAIIIKLLSDLDSLYCYIYHPSVLGSSLGTPFADEKAILIVTVASSYKKSQPKDRQPDGLPEVRHLIQGQHLASGRLAPDSAVRALC